MSVKYLTICDQQYNKKQFSEKWAKIVNGYELGVTISPGDTAFLVDVLGRIPRFAKILAKGRVTFRVIQRMFNGKRVRGIALVTPNSNYEVWAGKQSVIDSVFPKSSPHNPGKENRKSVLKALRAIIEPQIKEYRKRFAGKSMIKSSLSGKPIFGPYHVDHVYPFIRLVEEWCREKSYDLETIPVKCRGATCKLQSVEMAESWFDYHAFHAEFQVLDASENVSKGSRYYGRGK